MNYPDENGKMFGEHLMSSESDAFVEELMTAIEIRFYKGLANDFREKYEQIPMWIRKIFVK